LQNMSFSTPFVRFSDKSARIKAKFGKEKDVRPITVHPVPYLTYNSLCGKITIEAKVLLSHIKIERHLV